jgi:hypothetical protein
VATVLNRGWARITRISFRISEILVIRGSIFGFRISAFGFLSGFGFRVSGF